MAAWILLYCKRSLSEVTPEQVRAGIDEADWWTLAEGYGIEDEAAVNAALKYLRIKELSREAGKVRWRLFYRPARLRQIDIERWTDPSLVAEEVQEERPSLARMRKPAAKIIREHLAAVQETVGIEMGWDQLEGMPVVLAYEVARWLAHVGKGLIKDHDDHWWGLTRGGAYKHLLP
jgi:hypothetical protein